MLFLKTDGKILVIRRLKKNPTVGFSNTGEKKPHKRHVRIKKANPKYLMNLK